MSIYIAHRRKNRL